MSNFCIRVGLMAGTDLKQAILEAKAKAEFWGVAYVEFTFNGTEFCVHSYKLLDWEDVWNKYLANEKLIVC
jgi:hypothetical protein